MKQRIAEFPDQQEQYLYQMQNDGSAVVFIREFLRENHIESEEGPEEVLFIYNENEFIVDSNEITEEMIAEDPLSWLEYNPSEDLSLEDRVSLLENITLASILAEEGDV